VYLENEYIKQKMNSQRMTMVLLYYAKFYYLAVGSTGLSLDRLEPISARHEAASLCHHDSVYRSELMKFVGKV
jgi:hypothetical protein